MRNGGRFWESRRLYSQCYVYYMSLIWIVLPMLMQPSVKERVPWSIKERFEDCLINSFLLMVLYVVVLM